MNDQELKELFKSMKYNEPTPLEIARWKRVVRNTINSRSPGEWTRLAVACLVGVLIGATLFRGSEPKFEAKKNLDEDATIESVYVNL